MMLTCTLRSLDLLNTSLTIDSTFSSALYNAGLGYHLIGRSLLLTLR